ncbi:hypothetical protein BSKO_12063 [Bryopsis sp. KO-2023]|nr:hypothetical protein BSKO_12063 [Bryopsis sp. KO-2023]
MQIFVKTNGRTISVEVESCSSVQTLKDKIYLKEGVEPEDQRIVFEGRTLSDEALLRGAHVQKESTVYMMRRLLGGGNLTFIVNPRVQKETWSLYWKESMTTETVCLDPCTITVDQSTSVADLQAEVAKKLGWAPVSSLLRLEGFDEPWERSIHKGRELPAGNSLAECGIEDGASIATVRKALVAEGWELRIDSDDESSTDEEDSRF